jgi:hypothetical protein
MNYAEAAINDCLSIIIEIGLGMKIYLVLIGLSFALSSCFLFSKYKRSSFAYNQNGDTYSIPVIIPKGYKKERTEVDSSGNTILTYSYGPELFYMAYMADTSSFVHPIDELINIPRLYEPTGAFVYKGMDSMHLYWREVRQNKLRTGYRNVSPEKEVRFDSATNYFMVHPISPKMQESIKR